MSFPKSDLELKVNLMDKPAMIAVTLEWTPRVFPMVLMQTQEALDELTLSHLLRTSMSPGRCFVELDVEGDKHAVHAAVDEAREKLKRYAVDGVVRWLQPKE